MSLIPLSYRFSGFLWGELGLSLKSAGAGNTSLPIDSNGMFIAGPQEGLQATYCGLLEAGDWTHIAKDTKISEPSFTIDELLEIISESNKKKECCNN